MSRFNLFLTWIVYLFSVTETSIFLFTKHVTLGRKKLVSLRIRFAFVYPCSDTTVDFYVMRFSLSVTCASPSQMRCFCSLLRTVAAASPLRCLAPVGQCLSASQRPRLWRGESTLTSLPDHFGPVEIAFIGIVSTAKNITGMEIFFLCWVCFDSQRMLKSGGEHWHVEVSEVWRSGAPHFSS